MQFIVNKKTVTIDAEDWPKIKKKNWMIAGDGRVFHYQRRKGLPLCHIALHRFIDSTPKGIEIDHINRDIYDNRKANLRRCSRTQNEWNKPQLTGRFKGVSFEKRRNKWHAKIRCKGKQYFLGYFDYEIDAAKAYNEKAKELHGEFAWLNKFEGIN